MSVAQKVALNATALGAGRALVVAMSVLTVALVTRYLGVESYGALATAIAFVAVLGPLSDIGMSTIGAREIARRPHDTERLVGSVLTVGFVGSVVVGLAVVALLPLIYPGEDNERIRLGIALLLVTVPLGAPVSAVSSYVFAQQKAYVSTIGSVLANVTTLALVGLVVALDGGYLGMVLAYLAYGVAYGGFMLLYAVGRVRVRPSLDARLAKRLLRWAVPVGLAVALYGIYIKVGVLMLSFLSSEREVALYGLPMRVVEALAVLPFFITVTLLPEFSRLKDQREHLDTVMQKAFSAMQISALALLVVFVAFAGEVVRAVGGERFADAAPILQLLMVGVALSYLTALLAHALIALDRQTRLLFLWTLVLVGNVGAAAAAIPLWGATGAAGAFVASEALALACAIVLYGRAAAVPRLYRPLRVGLAALAMGLSAVGMRALLAGSGSDLLVASAGGAVSLAVYGLCLYALRAMPAEIHSGVVAPLWARLSPRLGGR